MRWSTVNMLNIFLLLFLYGTFAKAKVVVLNEDDWEDMLTDEWMVEFYAPWCPACKALQPVWDRFSKTGKKLGINVGQVDVTSSPGLSGRFMVTALPTIFHVYNGEFRQYRGTRDEESLETFIKGKKWKSVEAIPSWKSPGSIQMSVVSYFFKLSQLLRTVHNNLTEEYGLPTWGSYLIFACGTIIVGALLGLILVCVIEMIYPPKPFVRYPTDSAENNGSGEDHGSGDELDDGEDQDDLVDEGAENTEAENTKTEDEVKNSDVENAGSGDNDSEQKEGEGSPNVRKRKPRKAD